MGVDLWFLDYARYFKYHPDLFEHAITGNGPFLLESLTYRFRGHSMADPEAYRSKEEVNRYRKDDPIPLFRNKLLSDGVATQEEFDQIDAEALKQVEQAVEFAEQSPVPDPSTLADFILADSGAVR